jgi:hypothetical protein
MNRLSPALVLLLFVGSPLAYATHDHAAADKSAPADSAWLAQAKAAYPLTTCVVSEEKIGGPMGAGIDYVFQQEGKPDRLVLFCCKDCRKDFDKEPAKYLQAIDEAAAKAKKS